MTNLQSITNETNNKKTEGTMKNNKRKLLIAAIAATIIGTGAIGVTAANAQTATADNPMSSLVQKIAQKFNLNQSDVQAVFDQERTEREAQREAQYEQRLTQLVTDGKITDAQKQLILSKHKEMQANRETEMQNMQNMTEEQRKAAMEAKRTELETWAQQNNIDLQYLMIKGGHGMGKGFGGPGFKNKLNSAAPSTTATPSTQ